MPALEAFNMKWTIGSDDLVFPYSISIAMKALWFILTCILISINSTHHCNEETLLRTFVILLLSIQLISALIQIAAVILSARGTIANPSPRRHLRWVLYLQTSVFILELIWECVGVVWAFDPGLDCSSSHAILVITRLVLIWNVTMSILTATYMFLRMGLCKILLCRRTPPWRLSSEGLPPSRSFGGRRLSRMSSHSLAHHIKRRRWQWLVQSIMCCGLTIQESQRNVFQEVSVTLAEAFDKFRGYVVSDIIAGVVLLELKQRKERASKDAAMIDKSSKFSNKEVDNTVKELIHYLKFSMASYGWVLYVYAKGIRGLLQLIISSICHCLYPKEPHGLQQTTVLGDNRWKWNLQAVMRWTDIRQMDLIHANFSRDVYCPSFIVAIDHVERSVVVAIRGTLSISDTLIDLSAQPSLLMTKNGINFFAHQGIKDSTHSLHLKLEGEGILSKIFKIYPSYKLVITGHSLGGGVAALLAMILQPVYPNLHCYAFSPPGGLINLPAISHTKSFVTSVILGHDLVPRLSLQNFELFSRDVLYQLQNSKRPKYRIFLSSFIQWLGLNKLTYKVSSSTLSPNNNNKKNIRHTSIRIFTKTTHHHHEEDNQQDDYDDSYTDSFEDSFSDEEIYEDCLERQDKEEEQKEEIEEEEEGEGERTHFINTDPITGKTHRITPKERPLLYLPGRIIHLQRGPAKKRCYCIAVEGDVSLHWSSYDAFSELLIDEEMISDHMADELLKALQSLTND